VQIEFSKKELSAREKLRLLLQQRRAMTCFGILLLFLLGSSRGNVVTHGLEQYGGG